MTISITAPSGPEPQSLDSAEAEEHPFQDRIEEAPGGDPNMVNRGVGPFDEISRSRYNRGFS